MLARYASGGGDADERQGVEQHLDGCGACRAVVAVLAQTAVGTAASALEPDLQRVMGLGRVGDRYDIEAPLGAGGMGVVVAARHSMLGHAVAIKVLRPSLKLHAGTEARFLVEARAGARLTSPHVARVLDGGQLADGLPFLVMERLEGEDGDRFLSHGVPSMSDALDIVVQVLEALSEAHAIGLVHRDLKPSNVFISRHGSGRLRVKVLDFGLAKVMGVDQGLTSSQGFLGSPLYVAPEQLRNASEVDARVDIWGVGCLLYRFLTGRVPFPAGSVAEVVTRIQRDEPTPVRVLRPDVPEGLSALVSQLLEKNPHKRPASASEVGLRLRPFVSGATAIDLDALVQQAPRTSPSREPKQRAAGRMGSRLALTVGVAVCGVGIGWVLARTTAHAPPMLPAPALEQRSVGALPKDEPERAAVDHALREPGGPVPVAKPSVAVQLPARPRPRRLGADSAPRPVPIVDAGNGDAFESRE